jgi:hypothetical protein
MGEKPETMVLELLKSKLSQVVHQGKSCSSQMVLLSIDNDRQKKV